MKPLALALLAALAGAPSLLRAQTISPSEGGKTIEDLKKKYANGGQKPEAPPAPPEAKAPLPPARDQEGGAPMYKSGLMPALYARSPKGPDGYSLSALENNLKWTEKNLGGLIDYIHPWRKGEEPPVGEEDAAAHKMLASESAAARELIAEAEAALAKGIQRDPKDPNDPGLRKLIGYLSRASYAYRNPTPAQRLEAVAAAQANVLGHSGALIEYKRLNPTDAEGEANTERWLEGARKSLKEAEKSARE